MHQFRTTGVYRSPVIQSQKPWSSAPLVVIVDKRQQRVKKSAMAALTRAMGVLSISPASVCVAPSSGRCALRSSSASVSFSSSSFVGVSLRPSMSQRLVLPIRRNLVVRAKRPSLGCTKRSRSRKSRARVSGFRARIQTPTGRNVLRRRRAKGRYDLVPASNPNSGKLA